LLTTLQGLQRAQHNGEVPPTGEPPTQIDRLEAIIEINRSLASTLDADSLVRRILSEAVRLIPADAGVLLLHEPDRDRLVVRQAIGFGPHIYKVELVPGEGLTGLAFQQRESMLYRTQDALPEEQDLSPHNQQIFLAAGDVEWPHSVIVVPLLTMDGPIGVMILENLSPLRVFDQFDLRLFEGLARGAAIAIVNARLFESESLARIRLETVNRLVSGQRDQLERRVRAQEALADIVHEGLPVDALVTRLARMCGASVFLCDSLRAIRAAQPPAGVSTARDIDGEHRDAISAGMNRAEATRSPQRVDLGTSVLLVVPVPGGAEILGFLCALFDNDQPDDVDIAAVSWAAYIAAMEFVEQRAREEGRVQSGDDTIERLIRGETPAQARGPLLLAVGGLRHDARIESVPDRRRLRALLTAARHEFAGELAAATIRDGQVVLVWADAGDDINERLRRVAERFATLGADCGVSFVVSDRIDAATEFADALAETRLVAELHRHGGGTELVRSVRGLGAYRLILRSGNTQEIVTLCRDTFGEAIRHDRERRTALLPTLRAYLGHAGSTKAAAEELSVHPHTVQYRLGRLEKLTGLRLSVPADRLTLELCLRVIDAAALAAAL
jgi:hypothetical protein